MISLPEIKTAELSTYRNFAKCHQAHFRISHVGLGTRLGASGVVWLAAGVPSSEPADIGFQAITPYKKQIRKLFIQVAYTHMTTPSAGMAVYFSAEVSRNSSLQHLQEQYMYL